MSRASFSIRAFGPASWFLAALLFATSLVSVLLASGALSVFRIELGATEDTYLLGNDSSWGRAYRDHGPMRVRRRERRMTYFAARMAFPEAGIQLPVYPNSANALLKLRLHRYGQPGVVKVFGNGIELGSLILERDAYPWGVYELSVPQRAFRREGLRVDFRGEALTASTDLPPEALAGFDWVELTTVSPEDRLRLARRPVWIIALVPLAFALSLAWAISRPRWDRTHLLAIGTASASLLGALSYCLVRFPAELIGVVEHTPPVFAASLVVYLGARLVLAQGPLARRIAVATGTVLFLHTTILFFPNHQPADLGPHLGQTRTVNAMEWTMASFWDVSASFGEGGRGRPHFGADYRAPYPPWSYFIIHGLRQLQNHPRFWLEFLGMTMAAWTMALVFALTRLSAKDPRASSFAFALAAVEVSTWHHASRAHTPGMIGQFTVVLALTYFLWRYDRFGQWRTRTIFTALALIATISYTATLFQFVLFFATFTLVSILATRRLTPDGTVWPGALGGAAGTLGALTLFYGHFASAALEKRSAILAEHGYRAPATFWFLRNQMRDTARILSMGYPAFVLLAVPALVKLREWTSRPEARRFLIAWTTTYASLLILKDPALLPQLFLHAKEDLFFAPAMCALGGMTLAAGWAHSRAGKAVVVCVLGVALGLQARDYLYNADMIAVWAVSQRTE